MSAEIRKKIRALKRERRDKIGLITQEYDELEEKEYSKCKHAYCDWFYRIALGRYKETRICGKCGYTEVKACK